MARLMHEMSKRKEKDLQGEEVALVSRQSKGGDPRLRQSRRCVSIVVNQAILQGFATKQRARGRRMPTMRRSTTNLHLQQNSKRIREAFANGSWIREPQMT